MSNVATILHATAIVVGTRGLLFTGPSGAGKSSLAFSCIAEARAAGQFACLVADDGVEIDARGDRAIARCPASIRGLLELRYGGIASMERQSAVVLDYAVLVVDPPHAERLPQEEEQFAVTSALRLPLLRLPRPTLRPLAFLEALFSARAPTFRQDGPRF